MKKIFIGFFVVLLAAATAFAGNNQPVQQTGDPNLHWFDASGNYIGQELFSVMQSLCPYSNSVCAEGFTDIAIEGEKVVPAGELEETVRYNN